MKESNLCFKIVGKKNVTVKKKVAIPNQNEIVKKKKKIQKQLESSVVVKIDLIREVPEEPADWDENQMATEAESHKQ